jgi:hypothetical protein
MSMKAALKQFESAYLSELDRYTPEQFAQKPASDEWSLGQMYNHLLASAFYFQLRAVEKCMAGEGSVDGEKTEAGQKLFAAGAFPDVKIKLPDRPEFTPENTDDKEEVKRRLHLLIRTMREREAQLAEMDSRQKVQHRAFGWLDAEEWFQLITMHFRHHRRQKRRIDRYLFKHT